MPNQNQTVSSTSNQKHFKAFWPIVAIAVLSAIVGGMIVYIVYNQGLDEQLSTLLPGSNYRKNHMQNSGMMRTKDYKSTDYAP